MNDISVSIPPHLAGGKDVLRALVSDRFASRLFAKDHTLWGAAAEAEATIRLGWTDAVARAAELIPSIQLLRNEYERQGVTHFVLCGMGGSSLAPEVIAAWSGVSLTLLDSTHPAAVERALHSDLESTAVIVSSKSGSTIETRSHLAAFTQAFREAQINPADRIVVITDPGSELEHESRSEGRRVFLADPTIGGRFSAFSAFGLVPSGLAGANLDQLVHDAHATLSLLSSDSPENPALLLAATIAAGLPDRYVMALSSPDQHNWGLGAWIEQLIAESTGKNLVGVLPIDVPLTSAEFTHSSSSVLPLMVTDVAHVSAPAPNSIVVTASLGAQLLLWQVTTAALGRILGVDPFNQPDVESAKVAAREALGASAGSLESGNSQPQISTLVAELRTALVQGTYLSLQAFVDRGSPAANDLPELRERISSVCHVPVSLDWGPRYLHSTGQLHKGGPSTGVFLQIVDTDFSHLNIPGTSSSFGDLMRAQALGDAHVLRSRGRTVFSVHTSDVQHLVRQLIELF